MHEPQTFEDALRQWLKNSPFVLISASFHALVLLLAWALYTPQTVAPAKESQIVTLVRDVAADPIQEETPPPLIAEPEPIDENDEQIDDPFVTHDEIEGDVDHEVDAPDTGRNDETQMNDTNAKGEGFGFDSGDAHSDLIGVGNGNGGVGGGRHGRFGRPGGPGKTGGRASQKQIDLALGWLARHQDDDGHWSSHGFAEHCSGARCTGEGEIVHDVGVTGLALLALLGCGNTESTGEYREQVKRGFHYLTRMQDKETGCFGEPGSHQTFLYDHAIATLAMTEGFGLSRSPLLKAPAQRGLDFIAMARNPYRAWRYQYPPAGDNDLSVTCWMVMALTSGQDFGLSIDGAALAGARTFIDEMTDEATGRAGYNARGGLSAREPGADQRWPANRTESMTAAAILCRVFLGEDPDQSVAIRAGADRLMKQLPSWDEKAGTIDFYYWYYGTYAMYQLGGSQWDRWSKELTEAVVKQQRKDGCEEGSWDPQVDPWGKAGGRVYSTALMGLTLQAFYRYDRVLGGRASETKPPR